MTVAIGCDLGGTKMLVGAMGSDREVLYRATEPSGADTQEELLAKIEQGLRHALEAEPDAAVIGLGIPCTMDWERGIALQAVNLPLRDVPIRDLLSERLGLRVLVDNDANVAALAEQRFGAARGARNALMLTIGTGIGGGVVLDGQPFRGSSGGGAEIGHMVIDWDGPPCQGNCPNRGCIEALCSGTAIGKLAVELAERHADSALGRAVAGGEQVDARSLIDAAIAGDEVAAEALNGVALRLGAGLSGLANIFEPDVIAIGGGVMAAGELLLGPARQSVRERALPPQDQTPIVAAELGPDAGMFGAAAMALEAHEAAERGETA